MTESFEDIFKAQPFRFQEKVAECLLSNRSVILRAPTGAGKTRAALFPFLFAHLKNVNFPRQMIYSLPLRTLATSLYLETKEAVEASTLDLCVTIQTGEQPNDPQLLSGDIIFATYDQTLSSFLTIPVGLSKRSANINAGAMIASYLVFDEFHLMEGERSLTTMATMLQLLKNWTPFLLMTATLSETMASRLAECLNAEVVSVTAEDLKNIPSQCDKERIFQVEPKLLTAEDITQSHSHRSIAVCNTVDRAQQLFANLEETCPVGHELILLHSRFLPDDRAANEKKIRAWFGKDVSQRKDAILVATQAIEVGLDLTCEHLHTEIAPAAAIIQRAGRCARFPGEKGTVHIYDVPLNENGDKSYLPYDGKGERPLCPETWKAVCESSFNKQLIGFVEEQKLIRRIYDDIDKEALTDAALNSRRGEIAGSDGVWTTLEGAEYRNLVRFVDSRTFFVHPDPESIEDPFAFQTFSVSPGTLANWHKTFDQGSFQIDTNWFARVVVPLKGDEEKSQRYTRPVYQYPRVEDTKTFYSEYFFVINPKFIDYSKTTGLRFKLDGTPPDILIKPVKNKPSFSATYHLETYQEHIERVWDAYQKYFANRGRFDYAAAKLESLHKVSFDQLIRATVAAHDIGKLNAEWQRWVEVWQRQYKKGNHDNNTFYAHTDYDENIANDKRMQNALNAKFRRPPHAGESTYVIADVLHEKFPEPFAKAALTAITRHHSPTTDTVNKFALNAKAQKEAGRVFSIVTQEPWQTHWDNLLVGSGQCRLEKDKIDDLLVNPDGANSDAFLVYLLLVRALRISDQQSLAQ